MYKENNKNEISSYNDNFVRSASVIQGYDLRLAFFYDCLVFKELQCLARLLLVDQ